MIQPSEVYKIGVLGKPHGVHGEVNFAFTNDVFDRVDAEFLFCMMDGILVPFYLEEYRFKNNNTALVKFERINTAEAARRFNQVEVFVPYSWVLHAFDEGATCSDLVGFGVYDELLGDLGKITDYDDTTINELFVVDHHGEELLIPAQEAFIVNIDAANQQIITHLPDGYLDGLKD